MKFFDRKLDLVVYTDTQAYTIKNLHMDFNILLRKPKKTKKKEQQQPKPNQAQIVIFNLSEDTRGLFTEAHRGIDFKAGYGEDVSLIFRGNTVNVFHENLKPGWMTTIFASDGHKEWSTANFNKSYSRGTPITVILSDLGLAMGMPAKIDYSRADTLLVGASYSGKVKDVLNIVCGNYDLTWSIQNGSLEIIDTLVPNIFEDTQKTVLLSSDTGMIGSPIIQEESRNESGKDKKQKQDKHFFTVLARSLLNPEFFPGVPVKFEARNPVTDFNRAAEIRSSEIRLSNIFICNKVNHIGSNYTNEYVTEIETEEREIL